MFKFVSSLILILSLTSSAQAFQLAPIVGYRSNSAMLENAPGVTANSKPGSQVGALLYFSFLDTLALRTGLIYADKGFTTSNALGDVTYKLTYYDIPLQLQFDLPGSGLYLVGGFTYGLKASASAEFGGVALNTEFENSNTMLNAGLGFEVLELPLFTLGIEAMYEHGLSNIIKNSSSSTYTRAYAVNALARIGF